MCVDTPASLGDLLSHPITGAVRSHQPPGRLTKWVAKLPRGDGGGSGEGSVSASVTESAQ